MRGYRKLFPWWTNFGRRSRRFPWPFGAGLFHRPAGRTVISIWRSSKPSTALPRPASQSLSKLFLCLKQVSVVVKEFLDVILHAQNFGPLFLVERHREPADSVKRYCTLFTDLWPQATHAFIFQLIVSTTQPLRLCF